MTTRRPRSPIPSLRHTAFFEVLGESPSHSVNARARRATLLTLRLADEWMRSGAIALDRVGSSLAATCRAIDACVDDPALTSALRDAVNAMCAVADPDPFVLRLRLEPVAALWKARGYPRLAAQLLPTASSS
jgi:hypothetical protein